MMNDSEIMAKTSIEEQPASGRLRFSMKLPSGRDVAGSFQASAKTAGVLKWCEAIRAEIKADEEENLARQKRMAADKAAAAQSIVVPAGALPPIPPTLPQVDRGVPLVTDPVEFLKASVESAERAERYWKEQALQSTAKWRQAESDLQRWRQLYASMVTSSDGGMSGGMHSPGLAGVAEG